MQNGADSAKQAQHSSQLHGRSARLDPEMFRPIRSPKKPICLAWASWMALAVLMACAPKAKGENAYRAPALRSFEYDTGLVIETIVTGEGTAAKKGDSAKIHYIASILDGGELSTSHDGNPKYVIVGRDGEYVEGLHLGLEGMQVGELRRIVVPPSLGYRGRADPNVPPDAKLEFLVELFAIEKSEY